MSLVRLVFSLVVICLLTAWDPFYWTDVSYSYLFTYCCFCSLAFSTISSARHKDRVAGLLRGSPSNYVTSLIARLTLCLTLLYFRTFRDFSYFFIVCRLIAPCLLALELLPLITVGCFSFHWVNFSHSNSLGCPWFYVVGDISPALVYIILLLYMVVSNVLFQSLFI